MEHNPLSEREVEILKLVSEGLSNKEVAARLFISVNTVKVHVSNIFQKVGASSRTEATLLAIEQGIVKAPGTAGQPSYTEIIIPALTTSESRNQKPKGINKYWWTILFVIVALLIIIQLSAPSLSLFRPVPTLNPLLEVLNQNRMETIGQMTVPRVGFAIVNNDDAVYVIGGAAEGKTVNSVEQYESTSDSWRPLPEKPTPVSEVSAILLRGTIYVPGGRLGDGSLTNVLEVYDLGESKWKTNASLPMKVSGYALASYEGQLFLFGGWNGEEVSNKVYRYDPSLDKWFLCAPMPTARMNASASVLGTKILVIGGTDGNNSLASNEAFLPNYRSDGKGEWETKDDLPFECDHCSGGSLSDQLFVIGSDRIWQFSSGTEKWSEIMLNLDHEIPEQIRSVISPDGYIYIFGGVYAKNNPANLALKFRLLYTISIPNVIN